MALRLTADQRRALALLAEAARGVPESVLVDVHGFTIDDLVALIRAGLCACRCREGEGPAADDHGRGAVSDGIVKARGPGA